MTSRKACDADLDLVRKQPCLICGVKPSDPHHLPGYKNARRRTHDLVIPLCRMHHRWVHDTAKGVKWERDNLPNLWGWALGYVPGAIEEIMEERCNGGGNG